MAAAATNSPYGSRYAQTLSLIEGPLRIANTDFTDDRKWMLDLAEWNTTKALTAA